jgi:hypothetical protein
MTQSDAYRVIRRHARRRRHDEDRESFVSDDRHHGLLEERGALEKVAAMANHASALTPHLHDRRRDVLSLDEV